MTWKDSMEKYMVRSGRKKERGKNHVITLTKSIKKNRKIN